MPWPRTGDDLPGGERSGEEFTDLVSLAASLLRASMAALVVGSGDDARLIAHHGFDPAIMRNSTMLREGTAAVADAAAVPSLRRDPLVAAGARFAMVLPVLGTDGCALGRLLVADHHTRPAPPPADDPLLGQLGRLAARLLERHQLQRRNRIAAQIMQADFSAVVMVDPRGCVGYVNHAAERLFGGGARAMRGMPVDTLFPAYLQADPEAASAWLHGRGTHPVAPFRLRVRHGDALLTLEAARCAWRLQHGEGVALVLRDITAQLEQEERLRQAALVDPLTALPNRNAALAALSGHIDAGIAVGFAVVGLDNFKSINDTLGHDVGDAVLRATAVRLESLLPAGAMLARFGGDEFALVCPGADAVRLGAHLADLLRQVCRLEDIDGHPVSLEASIGIALCHGDDDCPAGELVARADLALYKAKAAGGRRCCRFDEGMREEVNARRLMELELRRAYASGEFEVHYQPQIDLGSGRTMGAEALLRWRHPERGLLLPVDFIDVLAASPVAAEVGRWIIRQACQDAAAWPRVGGQPLAISINLFPVQVNNGLLPHEIDQALAASGLPPERLELEITETIALNPDDDGARALAGLRARGVRLSFDDFGTGYASLSLLQRMPVDRVKIDRSFVRDMLANNGDAAIVKSILLISTNMALQVVAEGVESHEQALLLRGLGCHGAQGFLYAPALDPQAFAEWLAAHTHDPAAAPWTRPETAGHG